MKKIISFVLLMAGLLPAVATKAQTAEEIVNKHLEAIGGKEKLKQANSLYMEGMVEVMGNNNPTNITILNGKAYKSETDFNGQKIIQCFTETGGWAINPMAGTGATAMPDEAYKAGKEQINIGGALMDYAAKGSTVESLGKDGNNFKLKLTTKDKVETTYYIDGATYYISKITKKGNMRGEEVEINIQFTDYKKTDFGIVLPFTINTDLGQFQLAATYTKAEVNKAVDPAIFVMPK